MADIVYIAIFVVLLAIASIVGALYFYFKAKEDINPSSPFVLNFSSKDNNGRFLGREIQTEIGVRNRVLIDYKPLDIETYKLSLKEIKQKSMPEKVITDPEKIVSLAVGELSKDSSIKIILPDSPDDFPESIKSTILGKGLMWATMEQNLTKTVKEILEEGNTSRDKLLKKINDGELTSEWIQTVDSLMKDILRMKVQEEDKKHKPIIPSTPVGGTLGGFQS